MNITLNWNGFLFAVIFVFFLMGTVALIGIRSLIHQQKQKKMESAQKAEQETHSAKLNHH